ncbi:MAG: FG-GAP repeat domain-containing protein [Planctomycetota bacterium JB042]
MMSCRIAIVGFVASTWAVLQSTAGTPFESLTLKPANLPAFAFFGSGAPPPVADLDQDGWPDLVTFAVGVSWPDGHSGAGYAAYGPHFTKFAKFGDWVDEDDLAQGLAAADFDGDGHVDIAFGSFLAKVQGAAQSGRAFVTWGPSFQTGIELKGPPAAPVLSFGLEMVSADADLDGQPDLIVSSFGYDAGTAPGGNDNGRLDVYLASSGWSHLRTSDYRVDPLVPEPLAGGQTLGTSMGSGDFDGDGVAEILAWEGHTYSGPGFLSTGSIVVLDPPGVVLSSQISAPNGSGSFGTCPRTADFNGDGFPDIATGAPKSNGPGGESGAGHVRILYGPTFTSGRTLYSTYPQVGAEFGNQVAVGDLNRDGWPDVVGGSWDEDSPTLVSMGRAVLFYGPAFTTTQVFEGEHSSEYFATALRVADLDRDGFPELIVTAPNHGTTGAIKIFRHRALATTAPASISLQVGASIPLDIDAGALSANEVYFVLGSLSGSMPGFDVPSGSDVVHLHHNWDPLTNLMLAVANSPFLPGFAGTLDAQGRGAANLNWPAGVGSPALVGQELTLALVAGKSNGQVTFGSTALTFSLTP